MRQQSHDLIDVHLHRERLAQALRLRARSRGVVLSPRGTPRTARGVRGRRRGRTEAATPSRATPRSRARRDEARRGVEAARSGATRAEVAERANIYEKAGGRGRVRKRRDDGGRASFGIPISRRGCAGTATRRVDKRAVRRPRRAAVRSALRRGARGAVSASRLRARTVRAIERARCPRGRARGRPLARARLRDRPTIDRACRTFRAGAREGAATDSGRASHARAGQGSGGVRAHLGDRSGLHRDDASGAGCGATGRPGDGTGSRGERRTMTGSD